MQLGYDLNDNHNELVNYPMAMNYNLYNSGCASALAI